MFLYLDRIVVLETSSNQRISKSASRSRAVLVKFLEEQQRWSWQGGSGALG